jgi:hypothetical protein
VALRGNLTVALRTVVAVRTTVTVAVLKIEWEASKHEQAEVASIETWLRSHAGRLASLFTRGLETSVVWMTSVMVVVAFVVLTGVVFVTMVDMAMLVTVLAVVVVGRAVVTVWVIVLVGT